MFLFGNLQVVRTMAGPLCGQSEEGIEKRSAHKTGERELRNGS